MKKEFENQLAEKFHFMKHENSCEDQERPYAAFGCETGDGWYTLLYGLCEEITATYERVGVPIDIRVLQVKEKYGTLRFYCAFEGSNKGSELHQEIRAIVHRWEEKSATVCEECGADGKIRSDLPWILTLCDGCYREYSQTNSESSLAEQKVVSGSE